MKKVILNKMIIKRIIAFYLAFICCLFTVNIVPDMNNVNAITAEQQTFIENLGSAAQKGYAKYKILPSMTVAQAILESAWGKSSLSKLYYNFFGMKTGSNYTGESVTLKTGEEVNGVTINVSGTFRVYHSFDEGIEGYYQFITGYSRYSNLIGETDYKVACQKIKDDGWATDSSYATKLINLIETYNLTRFDNTIPPILPGTVDTSYATPCTLYADHQFNTYNEWANVESDHYVATGDDCYVQEVYTNGYIKLEYPIPGGRRWAYAKLSDLPVPPKSTETILDYGDSFSALILNKNCWKPIMIDDNDNIVLGTENAENMRREIWKFTKNSDGSYRIWSYHNGKSLDVYDSSDADETPIITYDSHNENNQKWFIIQADYGIMLRPASSKTRVLDLKNNDASDGTPIQLYQKNNTNAQKFDIYKFNQPTESTFSVTPGTSYSNTKFTWTKSDYADTYTAKIWKDKLWEGPEYKAYSTTGTSWNITLPEGTYHAYVDSANSYNWQTSNIVTFTVKKGTCTHSFGSWTISKAATCTATGTKARKCSICGVTETATIVKTEHKYISKVIAPTCTAKGYTQYTCSCGDSYKDKETAALGHKISASSNNGVTTYTCSACKLSYKVTFEGNGTTQSPYLIANKEDLFCLAGLMNNPQTAELFRTKSYKQTENIDLTNKKWTPIGKFKINGKDTVCYFEKGFVYDGNNHSIFNMNINETSGYSGFIGKVNYGTVKNLAVYGCVSSTTEAGEGTAGIVGEVAYMGKVLNCSFNGNVSSDESSGGIVGHVWRGATIENCYHNGTVIGGKWAGGIVGLALDKNYESEIHTNINNCYHVGNVTGPEAGGILGRHLETGTLNKNNTLNINNCYYHKTSAENGLGAGTFTKNDSTPLISIMLKEAAIDLGNSFGSNDNEAINNSYPVFNWQLPSKVKGDINNDGKLQIADVVKLQKALSKVRTLAVSESITSDVNGDGKFNVFDLVIVKRMLLSK